MMPPFFQMLWKLSYRLMATHSSLEQIWMLCLTVLDRSNQSISKAQSQSSTALRMFSMDLDVCDAWRLHNPTAKEYTYFSPSYKSFSRIDYILLLSSLFSDLIKIEFLPQGISDHNAVLAHLHINTLCKPSRWRFNTFLLQNEDFLPQQSRTDWIY